MSIPISNYVDITSGVGAGATVAQRNLGLRVFTQSQYVPPNTVLTFSGSTLAADVGTYFGTTSKEYALAVFYAGWVSKNTTRANMLSFARWTPTAVGSAIYGGGDAKSLATFTAITTGRIMFVVDGVNHELTGVTLAAATSLATVASELQTAIQALGAPLANVTVTYDTTRNSFVLQDTTAASNQSITVIADTSGGTDLGTILEWTAAAGAIFASASAATSAVDTFSASQELSNNFGSFVIPAISESAVDVASSATALAEHVAVATANNALNVDFEYMVAVNATNAAAWCAALNGIGGVGVTLKPLAAEYPEICPSMILGATAYSKANSTQNYMYQQFNLTPSVTTGALAKVYDAMRCNYYGQTQNAGVTTSFYQRGKLMGGSTDPVDMNTYANEIWFKDLAATQILTLLLTLARLSANTNGRSSLLSILNSCITKAVNNGTISVGKTLTAIQQAYITEEANDSLAWLQVQNNGYWLDVEISSYTATDGTTEYEATYTLIYSKDDQIRLVNGTHTLI